MSHITDIALLRLLLDPDSPAAGVGSVGGVGGAGGIGIGSSVGEGQRRRGGGVSTIGGGIIEGRKK